MSKPKILIATGTRADWGLLSPLAARLRDSGAVELLIMATNMHLMERYGHTVDEIRADGFRVDAEVPLPEDAGDTDCGRAVAMGRCLADTATCFDRLKPDMVVLLGDRYEMLAVASAAAMMRIPVAHISGGETTVGAIDDSLRHAITKLSSLHFASTEMYRRRILAMGEDPAAVFNAGATGVWNAVNMPRPSSAELLADLGINHAGPFALVTYHPATLDPADPGERFDAMAAALDRFPALHCIVTYPNNDARSGRVIERLGHWASTRPDSVTVVPSLGMRRYLAATALASVVVGNSSSGVVEVPSGGTPTVDIGIRQQGRLSAPSVIHCADDTDSIAAAITRALSPGLQTLAARRENPYFREDTPDFIAAKIIEAAMRLPLPPKYFHDNFNR